MVVARLDAEERRNNQRLREEQDAAYRAALEADQVCRFLGLSYSMLCDEISQAIMFYQMGYQCKPCSHLKTVKLLLNQARERQRREEEERLKREAEEAERKRKEEEEALERAAREAAEKEAALARRQQEKAISLGPEPDKGPDVTQVSIMEVFDN